VIILGAIGCFLLEYKGKSLIDIMGYKALSLDIDKINLASNLITILNVIYIIIFLLIIILGFIKSKIRNYSSKGLMILILSFIITVLFGICPLGQLLIFVSGLNHLLVNEKIDF
jgi:RsiW-degrading membrane proteinase PrsW (M82 family)